MMIAKYDYKEFGILKDGRAYWNIGFERRLSGRKYKVKLVYPKEHPDYRFGCQGLWVYPIEPTFKMLTDEMNESSGNDYNCMPYSLRDELGNWHFSLCETEVAYISGWSDFR